MNLVKTSLSMTTNHGGGLADIHLIQKFSKHVQQYILSYYHLEHDCNHREEDLIDELNIKNVRKEFKTHRSAIDFNEQVITHAYALHNVE